MHDKPEIQDRFGEDRMVVKMSEGAEAFVYASRILGLDAVVKSRVRKGYRIKNLDERIRIMRTKKEARALSIASNAGACVPAVLLVDKYDICMERIKGRNLNLLLKSRDRYDKIFYRLGVYAGVLHNAGIAHGDYTPANVMVDTEGKPWIIDFGLSEMTNSFEEDALDLLLMKRSASQSQFKSFIDGYKKESWNSTEIIKRLAGIERRGRYQTRTLLSRDAE